MSVKRWHAYIDEEDDDGNDLFVSHQQDAKGGWVRYDDHAAEIERWKLAYEDIHREYNEKCERVEELRATLRYCRDNTHDPNVYEVARVALNALNAEKEGNSE